MMSLRTSVRSCNYHDDKQHWMDRNHQPQTSELRNSNNNHHGMNRRLEVCRRSEMHPPSWRFVLWNSVLGKTVLTFRTWYVYSG